MITPESVFLPAASAFYERELTHLQIPSSASAILSPALFIHESVVSHAPAAEFHSHSLSSAAWPSRSSSSPKKSYWYTYRPPASPGAGSQTCRMPKCGPSPVPNPAPSAASVAGDGWAMAGFWRYPGGCSRLGSLLLWFDAER